MAADTAEVITFQIGNYSNFVGAHFWNFQKALLEDGSNVKSTDNDMKHDILHRYGLDFHTGQKTYKPRVIAFDLKENIKTFTDRNERLENNIEEGSAILWEGAVEKYQRSYKNSKNLRTFEVDSHVKEHATPNAINDPIDQSKIRNKDLLSTWSDFSLSQFHEKSLKGIERLHSDSCAGFSNFGSGEVLFKSKKFHDEFEDRLHFFAEECDRLQGFQIFADIHDGFAGLTSNILLELADDYAKKGCLCFSMMPVDFEDDTRHTLDQGLLNVLLSFAKFVGAGCHVIPLSLRSSFGLRHRMVEFPYIDYKNVIGTKAFKYESRRLFQNDLDYHTSAILASAIDTATLAYRLAHGQATDINNVINHLSIAGRKITALSIGLPIPISSSHTLIDMLKEEGPSSPFTTLTPDICGAENILTQTTVVRGIPQHLLKFEEYQRMARQISTLLQYKTSLGNVCPTYIAQSPCIVDSPFPSIFKQSVTQVGCVIADYKRPHDVSVKRTSVISSLQNCEDVAKPLKVVVQETNKANVVKYPGFLEAGIEQGDVEGCREDIRTLIQAYQTGYDL